MKRQFTVLFLLIVASAIILSACGGGAAAPTATPTGPVGDPAGGKVSYDTTCIACHADLKGMTGLGKDLTTSEFVKSKSDGDLVAFILVGRPASDPANTQGVDMPPKGGNPALTEEDILNIVAYVRSMQAP
jgi:disulfide bond formation protein DsbB